MAPKFKAAAKAISAAVKVSKSDECVKVVIRCRPMNTKEKGDKRVRIVQMNTDTGEVAVKNPKADDGEPPKHFTFDTVYDWNSSQEGVYTETAAPLVESVIQGYNGTIFAYGQTGTGKTHTMLGAPDPPELRGIIPNTFKHIFEAVEETTDRDFLVRASFLEIYNEEIRDLLGKDTTKKLDMKEDPNRGLYVKDLTHTVVKGVKEIDRVLSIGMQNRSVASTLMNADSSRSHSIFTITIETSDKASADKDDAPQDAFAEKKADNMHIRAGKLNLVDLAGSERQGKTGATGDRLKEATKINLSLSALGNVISALVDGKSGHVPYRDSKLTRLLQDSLGGNTKTVMIAAVGPADYNFDETISTLRYANRAKNIKNKPKINEDPKDAMLREFQEEIERLKAQLMATGQPGQMPAAQTFNVERPDGTSSTVSQEELSRIREEEREKIRAEMAAVMSSSDKTDEEKAVLVKEIKVRSNEEEEKYKQLLEDAEVERNKFKGEAEDLAKKLAAMQSQVLHGGDNLLEKVAGQENQLRALAREVDEKRKKERQLDIKVAELTEAQLIAEEHYSSIQDEVEMKTRKLQKLWANYKEAKRDVEDLQSEFQVEREDMLDSIRELTRQLKLKSLIIDSFVPPQYAQAILRKSYWDEETENWVIENIEFSGNKVRPATTVQGVKRPTSKYALLKRQAGDPNPRYKDENLLDGQVELDMPERTTVDWNGPHNIPEHVLAANQVPFSQPESPFLTYEQDVTPDQNENYDGQRGKPKKDKKEKKDKKVKREKESAAHEFADDEEMFPKSRGLGKVRR